LPVLACTGPSDKHIAAWAEHLEARVTTADLALKCAFMLWGVALCRQSHTAASLRCRLPAAYRHDSFNSCMATAVTAPV